MLKYLVLPNGQTEIATGTPVVVDNHRAWFSININPAENVSRDDLVNLIQTKYEVMDWRVYGNGMFAVQIRSIGAVNESLKDLIQTKWEVTLFNETSEEFVAQNVA